MMPPCRRGRRPRVDGEPATARIWAFVTPSERRALRRLARSSRLSIGQVVREAVNCYVADSGDQKPFTSTGNSGRGGH